MEQQGSSAASAALEHNALLGAWGLLKTACELHGDRVACFGGGDDGCVRYKELFLRAKSAAQYMASTLKISRGSTVSFAFHA